MQLINRNTYLKGSLILWALWSQYKKLSIVHVHKSAKRTMHLCEALTKMQYIFFTKKKKKISLLWHQEISTA